MILSTEYHRSLDTSLNDLQQMLSLLASFAQEESKGISENCKWGIRKKFADGSKIPCNKHILGYRFDGEKYAIIPEEADAVRFMFNRYLEGVGYRTIAWELTQMGIRSVKGNIISEEYPIRCMLTNRIYVGDIVWQKSYVIDPLSQKKVRNNGVLPQYLIQDCHEAIISRELFEAVQQEIKRKGAIASRSALSHKIKCGVCGRYYSHRKNYYRGRIIGEWFCRAKKDRGYCNSHYLNEDRLKRIIARFLEIDSFDDVIFEERIREITALSDKSLIFHFKDGTVKEWRNLTYGTCDGIDRTACFSNMIKSSSCGDYYLRAVNNGKHVSWCCAGKRKKETMAKKHAINYNESDLARICAYVLEMEEFDETEFKKSVQEIIVHENSDLLFRFKDGSEKLWERML